MNRDQRRATVLGFLGAFVVLGILLYVVGIDEFLSRLTAAKPGPVLLVLAVTFGWLAAWGIALRTVLGVLGIDLSAGRSFLVLCGAMFSNNVTPFGQAGGEPVTALLISRVTDTEYERGLAAIASVDTLNFVPSISLALIGAAFYATETTLGRDLRIATGVVAVLALIVPGILYLGWRYRYRLERRVVAILGPLLAKIGGAVPWISTPNQAGLESRIEHFFTAIERIASDRRGLSLALAASTLGWGFQMLGLWLAFVAIGVPVAFSVMLFVVPMGAIAGVTPLPGGAGGIEAVLVTLLVAAPLPAVNEGAALAAVVVYRGAVYWVPTLIGGVVVSYTGVRTVR